MYQTVKQRIIMFIEYKNISVREFERTCGLSYGYVNNMRVSIQPDKLMNIAVCYPDLNTGWVITGEGSMLKSTASDVIPEYGIDYKEKYYDALEEIREIRRELDSVKNVLLHAKEDTPIVQGNVRGAGTG